MEGLQPLHRRVAGIDVHRMLHVVTVVLEQPDGSIEQTSREFGGFRRDCRALAAWLAELRVELVVMESTGIYWKSVHAHLENAYLDQHINYAAMSAKKSAARWIKNSSSSASGPRPRTRQPPPALDSPLTARGRGQRLWQSCQSAGGLNSCSWVGAFTVTSGLNQRPD